VTAGKPPKPWFPIQGTRDATTLWYAVMRKQVQDVFVLPRRVYLQNSTIRLQIRAPSFSWLFGDRNQIAVHFFPWHVDIK